jgi:uncharacterized protein (TIGR00255 family)
MIRSMTAFGRKDTQGEWGSLSWEVRSVNHRFLEPSLRLPDGLRDLDAPVREALRKRLQRGKIECTLKYQAHIEANDSLNINEALLNQLIKAAEAVAAKMTCAAALNPTDILRWPGVLDTRETDLSQIQQTALDLFTTTLDDFIAAREREGAELRVAIEQRLDIVTAQVARVKQRVPLVQQQLKDKLLNRLAELKVDLDQDRLEQEMVYLAQKMDVSEELDRLGAHVEEVRRTLKAGGAAGRRLDFLMQEFNREANTLGAKSADNECTQAAVELKVAIEQMREQVQNIE